MQHQRYVLLIFVAAAILTGIIAQAATATGFERLVIPDTRIAGLILTSTVVSLVAGFGMFVGLLRSSKAVQYFDEVVDELYKVTWPTRDEAIRAATTVISTSLFVAALIGSYDWLWQTIANFVLYGGLSD